MDFVHKENRISIYYIEPWASEREKVFCAIRFFIKAECDKFISFDVSVHKFNIREVSAFHRFPQKLLEFRRHLFRQFFGGEFLLVNSNVRNAQISGTQEIHYCLFPFYGFTSLCSELWIKITMGWNNMKPFLEPVEHGL